MNVASHTHPVDAPGVAKAHESAVTVAEAQRLASLLSLLSDQTRLRILFVLVSVKELCVGDLALALAISMDQSSYALRQLRSVGMVQARREGRVIYYRLADGFPDQMLEHCLRQLLTIADKGGQA